MCWNILNKLKLFISLPIHYCFKMLARCWNVRFANNAQNSIFFQRENTALKYNGKFTKFVIVMNEF